MCERIKARGDGWVFSPVDFVDFGARNAVDKALSRMAADGSVRRVACGLYDVPKRHSLVGLTAPSIDQVPAKVVFLTGGRSKRIQFGKLTIALKQTSPRIMATAGTISGSIIQALRYLGKDHVTEETVKRLDRRLSPDDRKQLLKHLAYAPAWIALILRKLATLG